MCVLSVTSLRRSRKLVEEASPPTILHCWKSDTHDRDKIIPKLIQSNAQRRDKERRHKDAKLFIAFQASQAGAP